MSDACEATLDLLAYIKASPTPQHCVAQTAARLETAGFSQLDEAQRWHIKTGGCYYIIRAGSLVAFRHGHRPACTAGFRLIGAHTDSPNLRLKPKPDVHREGYVQAGVEVYGGALLQTWFDRDLGVAGTVFLRQKNKIKSQLICIDEPLFRIPSLAIHLNRTQGAGSLELNTQQHLAPVLALDTSQKHSGVMAIVSQRCDIDPKTILSFDLSLMDTMPPQLGGYENCFVFAPRLDNQSMCHGALLALLGAITIPSDATQVICLYDHEEVGSHSHTGAAGPFVAHVLQRICELEGQGAEVGTLPRAIACSLQLSADMAHAVHPNYIEKSEPQHMPKMNRGPVIKVNAQQRYATEAATAARLIALCTEHNITTQQFVSRTDLPCGSTIGPISAVRLGIPTVDVGNAMLSMHSIREQCGSADVAPMIAAMTAFLGSPHDTLKIDF